MSDTANQGSETLMAVTNFLNSFGRHFEEVLRNLGQVLQTYANTEDMRALGKYIGNGGEMVIITVDDRILKDLEERLKTEKIGFLGGDIAGPSSVILVPTKDTERLKEIEVELLKEKGLNVVQMSIDELCESTKAAAINKERNLRETPIYELRGISEEEALAIKDKCKGINKDFAVGIDMEGNGECNFAVRGSQVFSFSPDEKDFARAFLDSTIFLYGARNEDKYERLVSQKDFLASLPETSEVKRGDEHKYIYGKQDNKRFIEIDENGFNVYNYSTNNKKTITRDCLEHVSKSSPEYMEKLTGYCMYLQECQIGDLADLSMHCQKKDYDRDYRQQLSIELKERKLAEHINEIVKTKMAKEPRFKNETNAKILMSEYIEQSRNILDAVANNRNPYGITKEQTDFLFDYMHEAKLNLEDYRDCKHVLDRFDMDKYTADSREKYYSKKFGKNHTQIKEHSNEKVFDERNLG